MARVTLELPEQYDFKVELEVRIGDINYGGHLGNDRVLALAHEARARLFAHHGYSELDVEGRGIIVADAVVVYRAEAFFGDSLRIQLAARDWNRYGFDLIYFLTRRADGREIARAKTGIVFFDYAARKIASVPPAFQALFDSPA